MITEMLFGAYSVVLNTNDGDAKLRGIADVINAHDTVNVVQLEKVDRVCLQATSRISQVPHWQPFLLRFRARSILRVLALAPFLEHKPLQLALKHRPMKISWSGKVLA